jgi:hypothetical protein
MQKRRCLDFWERKLNGDEKKHTLRNFTNLCSTEILCRDEVEGHVLGKGEMRKAYAYLGRQTWMEETAVEGSISVWENSG